MVSLLNLPFIYAIFFHKTHHFIFVFRIFIYNILVKEDVKHMNNNNTNIQEAINQILSVLEEKEISAVSLKDYRHCYCVFQKYLEHNGISGVNEKICLDYLESKSGRHLESLWCTVTDVSINRRLRPIHLLLKYLNTGEINLDTRPKTPDFHCPDCFCEVYDAFCYLLSKSGLAVFVN